MTESFALRIVKLDDHQEWTVNIDTGATIDKLIKLVAESTGMERNQFRLVFKGRIISNLPPEHLIHDCGITSTDNSIILVQRRVRQINPDLSNRISTRTQDDSHGHPIFEEIAPSVYRIRGLVDETGMRTHATIESTDGMLADTVGDMFHGMLVSHDGESTATIPITNGAITTRPRGRTSERSMDPSNSIVTLATLLTNLYADEMRADGSNDSFNAVINITTHPSASTDGHPEGINIQTIPIARQAVPSSLLSGMAASTVQNQMQVQGQPHTLAQGQAPQSRGSLQQGSVSISYNNPVVMGLSSSSRSQEPVSLYRSSAAPGFPRSIASSGPFNQIFLGSVPSRHGSSHARESQRCLCNSTQTERVVLPFGTASSQNQYNSNVSSITEPPITRRNKPRGNETISRARQCLQRARNVRYLHTDELQALLSDLSEMVSIISTDINVFLQKLAGINRHQSTSSSRLQEMRRTKNTSMTQSSSMVHSSGSSGYHSGHDGSNNIPVSSTICSITPSLVVPQHGHDQLHGSTTNYFSESVRKRIFNLMSMLIHLNAAIPHCIEALRNALSNSMLQIAAHRLGIAHDNPIAEFGSNELFSEFLYRVANNEFSERNLIASDDDDDSNFCDWNDPSCNASFQTD